MADNLSSLFDAGGATWNLPSAEAKRQAIASLRGYAYQLHQSLAAWIGLPDSGTLHLEVAEDYAIIVKDPGSSQSILNATQIKDTRESGSVTLNSPDAFDAIRHLWALQEANPDRPIRLTFLTTSPIGMERKLALECGTPALELWRQVARGQPADQLKAAIKVRIDNFIDAQVRRGEEDKNLISDRNLREFIDTADDAEFRNRLIRPMIWSCGNAAISSIEEDNKCALIELGQTVGGVPDLSARAADILLCRILSTIIESSDRRLTRADLLVTLQEALTVRVPAQSGAFGSDALTLRSAVLDLTATGAWAAPRKIEAQSAPRSIATTECLSVLSLDGCLWLHGSTGFGKTTLAELVSVRFGGVWRLLDLQGSSSGVAAERIDASIRSALATPGLVGVIVDDVSPDFEQAIANPLLRLSEALRRRNILLVITSRNPPGRKLERATYVKPASIILAPHLVKRKSLS